MIQYRNIGYFRDRNTLVFERVLPVSPNRAWQAIATRDGLSHWFMSTDSEIVEDGRFSFKDGWDGVITKVAEPEYIVFTPDDTKTAFLRFEIQANSEGCLFRLIDRMDDRIDAAAQFPASPNYDKHQPGGPGTHWSGIIAGYHGFADALVTDYEALCRLYMARLDE